MTKKSQTLNKETQNPETEESQAESVQIQLYTADMLRKLKEVARGLKLNETEATYQGLLLSLHDGLLTVTAGNKDLFLECDVPLLGSNTRDPYTALVDKNVFVDGICNFEHDLLMLECDETGYYLTVSYDNDKIMMPYSRAFQYLENLEKIKALEFKPLFEISAADMITIQKEVAISCSLRDARKQLTGVNLISLDAAQAKNSQAKTSDPYLIAQATDAYRLSKKEFKNIKAENLDITIPSNVFKLNKLFDKDATIQVKGNDQYITLESGNVRMIARTYEGNYPDIYKIFPKSFSIKTVFDSKALLSRLTMAAKTTKSGNVSVMKFVTGEDCQSFDMVSLLKGECYTNQNLQAVSYAGEAISICFNNNFMLDAIKALGKVKNVCLEFISYKKPIRITSEENPDLSLLVVPLRSNI